MANAALSAAYKGAVAIIDKTKAANLKLRERLVMLRARMGCECTRQRRADQDRGLGAAEESSKRTEPGPLCLAERDFVDRLEPIAQRLESVRLADLVDGVLHRFAVALSRHVLENVGERCKRRSLLAGRLAVTLLRVDEVLVVFQGVSHKPIQTGMRVRVRIRRIGTNEAPQHLAILRP